MLKCPLLPAALLDGWTSAMWWILHGSQLPPPELSTSPQQGRSSICDIRIYCHARRWGDHIYSLLQVRKDTAPGFLQVASPRAGMKRNFPSAMKGCGVSLSWWHLLSCFIGEGGAPKTNGTLLSHGSTQIPCRSDRLAAKGSDVHKIKSSITGFFDSSRRGS